MSNDNLIKLISLDVPKPIKKQYGFLDIIRKAHDENINSRIYAYFLNAIENPEISKIFLQALLNLVKAKYDKDFEIEDFEPLLEVKTDLGRIDIVLLQNDFKKVIIIENKIYHHLSNPLSDYWKRFDDQIKNEEDKLGILLTLHNSTIEKEFNEKYFNITHFEWMNEIKIIGLPFNLDPRTHIYLNDFFNTIQSLSNIKTMEDQAKFYFQHASKIREAINTSNSAISYILDEIQKVANELSLDVYGSGKNWRNIWDSKLDRKTFYTFYFEGLLSGTNENYIILEMQKPDMDTVDDILKYYENDSDFQKLERGIIKEKFYLQLFVKKLEVNISNPENLNAIILKEIKENFQPVMEKILKYIDNNKVQE